MHFFTKLTLQSLCTFFYIYMLSNLGEKISFQMRTDLFASILKQDIAFFDEQRTGEIINRYKNQKQRTKRHINWIHF
jgi:ABC-type multidrug transport system fused ATPase/permease subunit